MENESLVGQHFTVSHKSQDSTSPPYNLVILALLRRLPDFISALYRLEHPFAPRKFVYASHSVFKSIAGTDHSSDVWRYDFIESIYVGISTFIDVGIQVPTESDLIGRERDLIDVSDEIGPHRG